MTTVYLAYKVNDCARARVRQVVDDAMLHDAAFSGIEISLGRDDDYTWVDDSDEIRGAKLLGDVQRAIDEE